MVLRWVHRFFLLLAIGCLAFLALQSKYGMRLRIGQRVVAYLPPTLTTYRLTQPGGSPIPPCIGPGLSNFVSASRP